jgi:hypothetical protein
MVAVQSGFERCVATALSSTLPVLLSLVSPVRAAWPVPMAADQSTFGE